MGCRLLALAANLICSLIFPKAEIDRVPHFAGAGPFGKFYLRHTPGFTHVVNASSFVFTLKGDFAAFSLMSLLWSCVPTP
jgi:hypothetical protein